MKVIKLKQGNLPIVLGNNLEWEEAFILMIDAYGHGMIESDASIRLEDSPTNFAIFSCDEVAHLIKVIKRPPPV